MNAAVVDATVPLGPVEMVVSGAVVSTVHARDAGVPSTLPCASSARTRRVCEPSASELYDAGEVQAPQAPPSSLHSNVPASSAPSVNAAEVLVVVPVGPPVSVVCGAVASTVQVRDAGVASTLPTPSLARTSSVCEPSVRPGNEGEAEHEAHDAPSSRHS